MTFAARPQDYTQKLNRKMYRAGMRAILSELVRQERLRVVESVVIAEPRTRLVTDQLARWGLSGEGRVLIVVETVSDALALATRNLRHVQICQATRVDPVSLVGADCVIIERGALTAIEGWLQ